jgi:3-oxoacyl-[acyl-carrier-protein] synthase II
MTEPRRVAVTGIGAITPIGLTADGLWCGLQRERSAVDLVTLFDPTPFRSQVAAEVRDFVAGDHLESKRLRRMNRYAVFSVVAARMAAADAELDLAREDRDRIGTMMGSALAGIGYAEEQLGRYLSQGLPAVDAGLALSVFGGASSCNIAIDLGATGPNSTNGMSCASGSIAIGDGFRCIREGEADVMLCGGAEAPLAPLCYGAFTIIRAMSIRNDDPAHASRPFDKDRDGFVMGEGAAVLVLEELDRALARGAHIYAEILGYASTNDAFHMTAPRPDGSQAARAMRNALRDARVAPHEVGYINAHGSSTPLNDTTETLAIKQVFGDHAYRIPVSGTKGYYGHALGASGAIEAAICAMSFGHEWLPPTVNLTSPDPECDLDYVPSSGRTQRVDVALSNSFGFGGVNAVLVMKRPD